MKNNVTQLGNFDDIYDKIDDVDLFAKQSQKDIDYLMEITQPEQVQKICENEFYRLYEIEFKNMFDIEVTKMYEKELNLYNKEAQGIINDNLILSDKFKRRMEDLKDQDKQKLKKVYSHYQTHKEKYLSKLADFKVQNEKVISGTPPKPYSDNFRSTPP